MNKPKIDSVSRPSICATRSLIPIVHTEPMCKEVGSGVAIATIDIQKMAEDAVKMQDYIAKGGKQNESRGVKLIKPSGLFTNRGIG